MAFYIYQLTNTVNGKIYIGAHKGELSDAYMGSGLAIRHAISKHGRDSFTKTILVECESEQSMFAREQELVTPEFVSREDTYNLTCGGRGGFSHCEAHKFKPGQQVRLGIPHSADTIQRLREYPRTENTRRKMSEAGRQRTGERNGFYGKQHTETSKVKMGTSRLGNTNCVGRTYSEETRRKMSESAKARCEVRVN